MSNVIQPIRCVAFLLFVVFVVSLVSACGGGGGGGVEISGLPGGNGGGGGGGTSNDLGEVVFDGTILGDPGILDPEQSKQLLNKTPDGLAFQVPMIERENLEFLDPFDGFDFVTADGRNWHQSGLVFQETVGQYSMVFKVNGVQIGNCATDVNGDWVCDLDLNLVQSNIVELHILSNATGNTVGIVLLPFGSGLLSDGQEFAFAMIFDGVGGLMIAIRRLNGTSPSDNTMVLVDFTNDFDDDNILDQFNLLVDTRGMSVFDANLDGVFGDPVGDALYDFDNDGVPDVFAFDANFNRVYNEMADTVTGEPEDQIQSLIIEPAFGEKISSNTFQLDVTEGSDLAIPFLIKASYPGSGTPYGSTLSFELIGQGDMPDGFATELVFELGYGCAFASVVVVPDSQSSQELIVKVFAELSDGSVVQDDVLLQINVQTDVVPELTSLDLSTATAGTLISITGTGFSTTDANNVVVFGATPAVIFDASATRIRAFAPSNAIVGEAPTALNVSVISNGRPAESTLPFTMLPNGPFLDGLTPSFSAAVPSNANLILEFNKSVNTGTISSGITLTRESDGNTIGFTTDSSSNPFIVLTPSGGLSSGTEYRLSLDAQLLGDNGQPFDQISGGPENAFSSTFTAGAADNSGPSLTGVTPVSGAQDIDPSNSITLTFSDAIDPTTVDGDGFNLELTSSGVDVAGSFSFNSDRTVCTFTPDTFLQGSSQYTLTVSDQITDASGNGIDNGLSSDGVESDVTGNTIFTGTFTTTLLLTALSPISGPENTEVSITGTGLSSAFETNIVTFDGVAANEVSVIDNLDGTVTMVVKVPGEANTGNVVVTTNGNSASAGTFTVTLPGFEAISLELGAGPSSVSCSPDGGWLAVTSQDAGKLAIIQLADTGPVIIHNVFIAPIVTEALWIPSGESGPEDDLISVLHFGTPEEPGVGVIFVSVATGLVVDVVPVGLRPVRQALSTDGQFLDVSVFVPGLVVRIDLTSRVIVQSYQSGIGTDGVTECGSLVYSVNFFDDTLTGFNTVNNQIVGNLNVGDGPARVQCNGSLLAISLFNENAMAIYNVVNLELLATIPVSSDPAGFDFSPDGRFLYVACRGADVVDKLNMGTFINEGSIATGSGPSGVKMSPDGSFLFVTNLFSNTAQAIFLQLGAQFIEFVDPPFADREQTVSVRGENFEASASVFFNDILVSAEDVTFVNSTQLDVVVPLQAMTGTIVVEQNDNASNAAQFFVTPNLPHVTGSNPPSGGVQVPLDETIAIEFNEPVDTIGLLGVTNASSLIRLERWVGSSWSHVQTTVSVDPLPGVGTAFVKLFILNLPSGLQNNAQYRLVAEAGVSDSSTPAKQTQVNQYAIFWSLDTTGPTFTSNAIFSDNDFNGPDTGDTLAVTFSEPVQIFGAPNLALLFNLDGDAGDTFGSGATIAKGEPNEVVITLGLNPQFTVAGSGVTKTLLAGATFGTPTALMYIGTPSGSSQITDPYGNPLGTGNEVDLDAPDGVAPALVSSLKTDAGLIELNFSEPVFMDTAVGQAVASIFTFDTSGSFGSGSSIQVNPLDAKQYIVNPGSGAVFQSAGPYPSFPGSTGIYVSLTNGFRDIAGNALPTGVGTAVDIGSESEPGPKIAQGMVTFTDVGNDGLNAGDKINAFADRNLNEGSLSVELADFALNVAGDNFGGGATVAYLGNREFEIVLGMNPVLTIKGVFDKNNRTAGQASGLDFSSTVDGIEDLLGNPAQDLNIVDADDNGRDIGFADDATPLLLVSATLDDTNPDGSVGIDDEVTFVFNKGICFSDGMDPLVLFDLPVTGDRFGFQSFVKAHADGHSLVAVLGESPRLKPGDTFSSLTTVFGSSSGVSLQSVIPFMALTDLNGNAAVAGSPVDLGGQLSSQGPMISGVVLFDNDFNGPSQGDLLEIQFDVDVQFAGVQPSDFQFSPSGTFGTAAQFFFTDSDLGVIVLGSNASFPLVGTTLDVKSASFSKIKDGFGTPAESNPTSISLNNPQAPCLLDAFFDDSNQTGQIDSGDTIFAIFDSPILFTDLSANLQFTLVNSGLGYTFGLGAVLSADVDPTVIRILLGTDPEFVLGGNFAFASNGPGSPTGLGLSAASDITDLSDTVAANDTCFADLSGSDNEPPQLLGAFGLELASTPDGILGPGDLVICKFDENVVVSPNFQADAMFNLPVVNDRFGQSGVDTLNFSSNRNASNSVATDTSPSIAYNGLEQIYVTTWVESGNTIKLQRVNTSGTLVGNPITLITSGGAIASQCIVRSPASNAAGNGAFILIWEEATGGNEFIRVELIRSDGTILDGPVNLTSSGESFAAGYSLVGSQGPSGDLYFVAAQNTSASDDRVMSFTANNGAISVSVTGTVAGVSGSSHVAANNNGDFALLFDSGSGLQIQGIAPTLTLIGSPYTIGSPAGAIAQGFAFNSLDPTNTSHAWAILYSDTMNGFHFIGVDDGLSAETAPVFVQQGVAGAKGALVADLLQPGGFGAVVPAVAFGGKTQLWSNFISVMDTSGGKIALPLGRLRLSPPIAQTLNCPKLVQAASQQTFGVVWQDDRNNQEDVVVQLLGLPGLVIKDLPGLGLADDEVAIFCGKNARVTSLGDYNGTLLPGSPSGMDISASIPFGALTDLSGNTALDLGIPKLNDTALDILDTDIFPPALEVGEFIPDLFPLTGQAGPGLLAHLSEPVSLLGSPGPSNVFVLNTPGVGSASFGTGAALSLFMPDPLTNTSSTVLLRLGADHEIVVALTQLAYSPASGFEGTLKDDALNEVILDEFVDTFVNSSGQGSFSLANSNPTNGATQISTLIVPALFFTDNVDSMTLSGIRLDVQGGVQVTVFPSVDAMDASIVNIAIAGQLSESTVYDLTVQGVKSDLDVAMTPAIQVVTFTTAAGIAPIFVQVEPDMIGALGQRNPLNKINQNNQLAPVLRVGLPVPPTGLNANDLVSVAIGPFVIQSAIGANLGQSSMLINMPDVSGLSDGNTVVQTAFMDSGTMQLLGGVVFASNPTPVKDTLGPEVDFISFDDDGSGNALVATDFLIQFTKPVSISQATTPGAVDLLDSIFSSVGHVVAPLNESPPGFASLFSLAPNIDLNSSENYKIEVIAANLEGLCQNLFDDVPGGAPDDFQFPFTSAFAGTVDPLDVRIVANLGGGIGTRNPENKINQNNLISVTIEVDLPNPPTGLQVNDLVEIFLEDGAFFKLPIAMHALTSNELNTTNVAVISGVNATALGDGALVLQARFVDQDLPNDPLGSFVLSTSLQSPFKDTIPFTVGTFAFTDDGMGNATVATDFDIFLSKPTVATDFLAPGIFTFEDSLFVAVAGVLIGVDTDVNGFATHFNFTPTVDLTFGEAYTVIVNNALEDICLNRFDQIPGATPDDFVANFNAESAPPVDPLDLRILGSTGGAIGTNHPENKINLNNLSNVIIEVDIPSPPDGLAIGDFIEVDLQDSSFTVATIPQYPLTAIDLSTGIATLPGFSATSLVDGALTLQARFIDLDVPNDPLGSFVATQSPNPAFKDTFAPNVIDFQFTDDGMGNATVGSAFDIFLNKEVPATDFLAPMIFSMVDSSMTPVTGTLLDVDTNGMGFATHFKFTPSADLIFNDTYTATVSINLEGICLNQFDQIPGGAPDGFSMNVTTEPAASLTLDYFFPQFGKAGDVITIVGSTLTGATTLTMDGTPIPKDAAPSAAGTWSVIDSKKIFLILPDHIQPPFNGDEVLNIVVDSASFPGPFVMLRDFAGPTPILNNAQLTLGGPFGPGVIFPPQDNDFGGHENPRLIESIQELDFSAAFVYTANNLTRFDADSQSGHLLPAGSVEIELDEFFTPDLQEVRDFKIHPSPNADIGYLAVNNLSTNSNGVYPILNIRDSMNIAIGTAITVSGTPANDAIDLIAISPCGNFLAMLGSQSGALKLWMMELDPSDGLPNGGVFTVLLLTQGIATDLIANGLSFQPDRQGLFISYYDTNTGIGYIDWTNLAGGVPTGAVNVYSDSGSSFSNLAIHSDGTHGYMARRDQNEIVELTISSAATPAVTQVDMEPTGPCPVQVALDSCNDLVYVLQDTSIVSLFWESGGLLLETDSYVPGVKGGDLELFRGIASNTPVMAAQSMYSVVVPCELGSNVDTGLFEGGPSMLQDEGYIAQMPVLMKGALSNKGIQFFMDASIPVGKIHITIYDALSGIPLPDAGGWFFDSITGLPVTGYTGEVGTSQYFDSVSAGTMLPPGVFEFDRADLQSKVTPDNFIGFTAVDEATFPSASLSVFSVLRLDLSSSSNHVRIPLECDSFNQSFIKGFLDSGSTTVNFVSPHEVEFFSDYDEDDLLITPDPMELMGNNFYLLGLQPNVPNIVNVQVSNGGGVLGYGIQNLPRLAPGICWENTCTTATNFGPDILLVNPAVAGDPQPESGPHSINYDLDTHPSTKTIFTTGIEEASSFLQAEAIYRMQFPMSPGVISSNSPGVQVMSATTTGTVDINLVAPKESPNHTPYDLELFVEDDFGRESYTVIPGIATVPPPAQTIYILPLAEITTPVAGQVDVGPTPPTINVTFLNTINGAINISSAGPLLDRGLVLFEMEYDCEEFLCWRLATAITSSAGLNPTFTWPVPPSVFSQFNRKDGGYNRLESDLSAIPSAGMGLAVNVSDSSFAFFDESVYERNILHGSDGSFTEFTWRTTGVLAVGSIIGGTPRPREGHIAVSDANTPATDSKVLLLGGSSSTIEGGEVDLFDWSTSMVAAQTGSGLPSAQFNGVGLQLDIGPNASFFDSDFWLLGGRGSSSVEAFATRSNEAGTTIDRPTPPVGSVINLRTGREEAEVVSFWHENLSGDTDEHAHAAIVIGGLASNDFTVTASQMFEFYFSEHLLTLNATPAAAFRSNVDPTAISVTGAAIQPRHCFEAVLLSDYTKNVMEIGTPPNDGIARIVLFGGFVTVDNMGTPETTVLKSVQMLEINYTNAVAGTLSAVNKITINVIDLPDLLEPRALFSATPMWTNWDYTLNVNNYIEISTPSPTDITPLGANAYRFLVAGGAQDPSDKFNNYGSCSTEIYTIDVSSYPSNLGLSSSSIGPSLRQNRFGHDAIFVNGKIWIAGGAESTMNNGFTVFADGVRSVEFFDPAVPTELTVATFLRSGHFNHAMTLINTFDQGNGFQRVMISGGRDGSDLVRIPNDIIEILDDGM